MRLIVVGLAVYVPMLVEAARARRNEQAQRARGGIEPADDVFRLMRVAYPGFFLAMILEGVLRGAPQHGVVLGGALLFVAAKLLKWWAIRSLGPFWTFRVIVVPGLALVASGPYRYLRHPNYVAVAGELVGVGFMTGAVVVAPVAALLFGALLMKRMSVENRALQSSRGSSPGS